MIQIIWIYEHPVDLVALERFRDNWGSGWMARLIEPSPVPSAATGGSRPLRRVLDSTLPRTRAPR